MRLIDADTLKTELTKPIPYDKEIADKLWEGWHECTIAVDRLINNAPTIEPKWIPCSERLPEEFVDVLVCLTDGVMYVAQLTDYIDIWGEPKWCTDTSHHCIGGAILSSDIIAWMPLPKSYKGN